MVWQLISSALTGMNILIIASRAIIMALDISVVRGHLPNKFRTILMTYEPMFV